MGKKKKRRSSAGPGPATEPPGAGFGGLAAALSAQGLVASAGDSGSEPTPSPPESAKASSAGLRGKAVVRKERKGRGGKTVTVVDGAAIKRVSDIEALARTMRKALGTGARVEGGQVVLQGDQRTAASAWLQKQGATVVVGN